MPSTIDYNPDSGTVESENKLESPEIVEGWLNYIKREKEHYINLALLNSLSSFRG